MGNVSIFKTTFNNQRRVDPTASSRITLSIPRLPDMGAGPDSGSTARLSAVCLVLRGLGTLLLLNMVVGLGGMRWRWRKLVLISRFWVKHGIGKGAASC